LKIESKKSNKKNISISVKVDVEKFNELIGILDKEYGIFLSVSRFIAGFLPLQYITKDVLYKNLESSNNYDIARFSVSMDADLLVNIKNLIKHIEGIYLSNFFNSIFNIKLTALEKTLAIMKKVVISDFVEHKKNPLSQNMKKIISLRKLENYIADFDILGIKNIDILKLDGGIYAIVDIKYFFCEIFDYNIVKELRCSQDDQNI